MNNLHQHEADQKIQSMLSSKELQLTQFIAQKIKEKVEEVGQTFGKRTQKSIEWNAKVIAKAIRHEAPLLFLVDFESLSGIIDNFIEDLNIRKES